MNSLVYETLLPKIGKSRDDVSNGFFLLNVLGNIESACELPEGKLIKAFTNVDSDYRFIYLQEKDGDKPFNKQNTRNVHLVITSGIEPNQTLAVYPCYRDYEQTQIFEFLENKIITPKLEFDYSRTPKYYPLPIIKFVLEKGREVTFGVRKLIVTRKSTGFLAPDPITKSYIAYSLAIFFPNNQYIIRNNNIYYIMNQLSNKVYEKAITEPVQLGAKRRRLENRDIEYCGIFQEKPPPVETISEYTSSSIIDGTENSCDLGKPGCIFYSWHSHPYSRRNIQKDNRRDDRRVIFNPISSSDMNIYINRKYSINEIYTTAGIYTVTIHPFLQYIVDTLPETDELVKNINSNIKKLVENNFDEVVKRKDYSKDNNEGILLFIIMLLIGNDYTETYEGDVFYYENYRSLIVFEKDDKPLTDTTTVTIKTFGPVQNRTLEFSRDSTFEEIVKVIIDASPDGGIISNTIQNRWIEIVQYYNMDFVDKLNNHTLKKVIENVMMTEDTEPVLKEPLIDASFHPMEYYNLGKYKGKVKFETTTYLSKIRLIRCDWQPELPIHWMANWSFE